MANALRTYTFEIPSTEPLSIEAIMQNRYLFIKNFRHEPIYITIHPSNKSDLFNLVLPYSVEAGEAKTILGMSIEYDDKLVGGSWNIGKKEEYVEAIK